MTKFGALWRNVVGSLWFIPSTIVGAALLLALGMVELSTKLDSETLARWPRVLGSGADGARSMLSAIAGSMITVAGVTFSITMVAVTQASAQYTPRILRNFMRDRANQAVLGIFVGIFAYCLVVLRTIRGPGQSDFVPSLAVAVAVLLAILGIAVLIFFVHHIATTLQASEIIARITRETTREVNHLFPYRLREETPDPEVVAMLTAIPPHWWRPVPAPSTGYLQNTDIDGLIRLACDHDVVIRLEREVGEFVVASLPIGGIARHPGGQNDANGGPAAELPERVASLYTVSAYRTIEQDAGFGIRQLVDIALKALSPSVNDTTTAVTCVDYLSAILVHLANRSAKNPYYVERGVLRVVAPSPTFAALLRLAFEEIRQQAGGNVSVLARQLEALTTIAQITQSPARRSQVLEEVEALHTAAEATVELDQDRKRLILLATAARLACRESLDLELIRK